MSERADTAEATIRRGSKSFAAASRLFDARTRLLVWDLYAWCRHCDDVVDGQELGHGTMVSAPSGAALAQLRAQTDEALRGHSDGAPPFPGLARVVRETGLPAAYVHAHLDGFGMDVAQRRYASVDDTLEYCYHVAGVVGLMMAWIMGVRDEPTLLRGCDLGLAFQLTNIARDVGDDAVAGRVYLPEAWLHEAGGTSEATRLMEPDNRAAVVEVTGRLLDEADRYYASALVGIARLPFRCAWAIAAARHVYADIGREVRRRGDAAWETRVSTTTARKTGRLAQAFADALWARGVGRLLPTPPRQGLWQPPARRQPHASLSELS